MGSDKIIRNLSSIRLNDWLENYDSADFMWLNHILVFVWIKKKFFFKLLWNFLIWCYIGDVLVWVVFIDIRFCGFAKAAIWWTGLFSW